MGEEVKSESGKTSKIDLYEILFHDFEISQNAKTIEFRNQIAKKFNLLFHETYDTYDSAQNYEPRLQFKYKYFSSMNSDICAYFLMIIRDLKRVRVIPKDVSNDLLLLGIHIYLADYLSHGHALNALPYALFRVLVIDHVFLVSRAKCYINSVKDSEILLGAVINPTNGNEEHIARNRKMFLKKMRNVYFTYHFSSKELCVKREVDISKIKRSIDDDFDTNDRKTIEFSLEAKKGIAEVYTNIKHFFKKFLVVTKKKTSNSICLEIYGNGFVEYEYSDLLMIIYAPDLYKFCESEFIYHYMEIMFCLASAIQHLLLERLDKKAAEYLSVSCLSKKQAVAYADEIVKMVTRKYEKRAGINEFLVEFFSDPIKAIGSLNKECETVNDENKKRFDSIQWYVCVRVQSYILEHIYDFDVDAFFNSKSLSTKYTHCDVYGFYKSFFSYFSSHQNALAMEPSSIIPNMNDFITYVLYYCADAYICGINNRLRNR